MPDIHSEGLIPLRATPPQLEKLIYLNFGFWILNGKLITNQAVMLAGKLKNSSLKYIRNENMASSTQLLTECYQKE